jgi:HAMP domain-containing protein
MSGLDPAISVKYLVGGYTVFFAVFVFYLASLFARWRNLKRNLQSLEEIKKKQ